MRHKSRLYQVLGSYSREQFMITLGPDSPIVDPQSMRQLPLDADRVSVLFHEYAHFLQNTTTAAGYHGFRRALDLWCLFRETVGGDGASRGSSVLPAERELWISQLVKIGDVFDGWVDSDLPETFQVASFVIEGITVQPFELTLDDDTARVTKLVLKGVARNALGSTERYSYQLGTISIMEGLAYELDQIAARGPDGNNAPKNSAPPFPYTVLRNFVQHELPGAETRSILRIGCLALMSNDPAGALVDLCHAAKGKTAAGATLETAIAQIDASQIRTLIDAIIARDIPDHERTFTGRALAKALAHVHNILRRHLSIRKANPYLELSALTLDGRLNFDGVQKLFTEIPLCMVLQQSAGPENSLARDLLWVSDDAGFSLRNELAVLNCSLHFMLCHLHIDGFHKTLNADRRACPFYTCCSLPLRTSSPGTCKKQPWKSGSWTGWPSDEKCWYAVAVVSSMGLAAQSPSP